MTIVLPLTFLAGMAIGELWESLHVSGGLDREGLYLAFVLPLFASTLLMFAAFLASPQPGTPVGALV